MPFSASDDQYFVHQLPRTFDHVNDSERSWSDRCYFNAATPDGELMLVTGFGNHPNTQHAHGYAKLSLADGRHWDLDAVRRSTDRADLSAGPMRWTCIEPLKHWQLELGPNDSGIEWELHYRARAPLWELLPITLRKRGRVLADMQHIKQPGDYTGWIRIDSEDIAVDGLIGGRDRTFGIRDNLNIDFWVWFEAVFEDRAIEAWVIESSDGTVQYVDGGTTFNDGRQSKRFVKFHHDVTFDGDRRRALTADCAFIDEDGEEFHVKGSSEHLDTIVYYVPLHPGRTNADGYSHFAWDGRDLDYLADVESNSHSTDQAMRFESDGMIGHGIFEFLVAGRRYPRYPNWTGAPTWGT
jgi:hypothetical protein